MKPMPTLRFTAERVLIGLVAFGLAFSFVLYVIVDERWAKSVGTGAMVAALLGLVFLELTRRRRRAAQT